MRVPTVFAPASLALLFAALCLAPASALATQVLSMDLDSMTDRSDAIVWGHVLTTRAERPVESPGRIHTLVTVSVREYLRAEPGKQKSKTVQFSVPGGRLGQLGQWIPGAPRFAAGQELILLLARQPKTKRLIVVGLSQGRYVIERPQGAEPQAVSDRSGLGLLARGPGGRLLPAPATASLDRRPLSRMLARIRARLTRAR